MESKNSQAVTFGVFHLDFAKGRLSKFGTPVRLKPQPLKLLLLLVQRPGEVVTREEIQQQLWGDSNTFVDFDLGLNHCIRQIRAVLGDDAASPRYVETVPRSGYRFIAPVTQVPHKPKSLQRQFDQRTLVPLVATGKCAAASCSGRRQSWQ